MIGKRIIFTLFSVAVLVVASAVVVGVLFTKGTSSQSIAGGVLVENSPGESEETTSTLSDESEVHQTSSTSASVLEIFRPKGKAEQWTNRNVLVDQPCDFTEMRDYFDTLSKSVSFKSILDAYEIVDIVEEEAAQTDVAVNDKWLYACLLKVTLATESVAYAETNPGRLSLEEGLAAISPAVSASAYQNASYSEWVGAYQLTAYLADGPGVAGYGTFIADEVSVRSVGLTTMSRSQKSIYEVDGDETKMCPCHQEVKLTITNAFTEDDLEVAFQNQRIPMLQ